MVEEANRLAETFRAERRQQADAEYERIVGAARADIDAQTRRASEELRQQAADLAIAVVEKVIGEGIDAAVAPGADRPDHRRGPGPGRNSRSERLGATRASAATPTRLIEQEPSSAVPGHAWPTELRGGVRRS